MTTRSRISSGIRTYLGDLPDEPLPAGVPEHLIYEVLVDVETGMLIEQNLSDQNRRVVKKTVSLKPNETDFAVNLSTASTPEFAQVRLNSSDVYQTPVDIVNRASIDRATDEGRMAVAFYDTPLKVALSWIPQSGQQQELTLWFDRTIPMDGTLASDALVEDPYTAHLKLQAVAQIMELIGKAVGPVLAARILKGEEQYKKFVRSNGQQGVIQKSSSHPRLRRRRAGFQRTGGGYL